MTITRVWIEDGCIGCGLAKATQGIGGGLYEKIVVDEDGQLLTTTFMDYLIPSAMEIPDIEIHHLDQPSARNPLGVKCNAVPLSPAHILALINKRKTD